MKPAVRICSLLIILPALCLPWGSSAIQHGFVDNGIAADQTRATVLIPDPVQNLGQVSDQKQWQIMFPVRNIGNMRLVLNELDLECGCGDKSKQTTLVPPGETMEIAVPLDTRFAAGSVENCVSFTTNDPAQPRVTLTVRAFVLASPQPTSVHEEERKQVSVLVPQYARGVFEPGLQHVVKGITVDSTANKGVLPSLSFQR